MVRFSIVSGFSEKRNASEPRFNLCRAPRENLVCIFAQRFAQKRQFVESALSVKDSIRARVAAGSDQSAVFRRFSGGLHLIGEKRLRCAPPGKRVSPIRFPMVTSVGTQTVLLSASI